MIAAYDLATCPPTYDVVTFLGFVERERRRRQDSTVQIVLLPGPWEGFRKDAHWPRTVAGREQLLKEVVVPMCWMLPSTIAVDRVKDRREYHGVYGFGERFISLNNFVEIQRSNIRPLAGRSPHLRTEPKLITFTLREAEHHPLRNSNVPAWAEAAYALRSRYQVVIIRDTAKANEPLGDLATDPEASTNLVRRARLYAQAALNVGINNGPMWMAIMQDVPVLMLRPTTNIENACYDDEFFKYCGVPPGAQLPNAPPYQRLVWKEDTTENIVRAVEEALQ